MHEQAGANVPNRVVKLKNQIKVRLKLLLVLDICPPWTMGTYDLSSTELVIGKVYTFERVAESSHPAEIFIDDVSQGIIVRHRRHFNRCCREVS